MSMMINVINGYSFEPIFSYMSDVIPRENEVIHSLATDTTYESSVTCSEEYKIRHVVHELVKDSYTGSYSLAYINVFVESV